MEYKTVEIQFLQYTLARTALSFITYSYVVRTTLYFPVLIWLARDRRQLGEPLKCTSKGITMNQATKTILSMSKYVIPITSKWQTLNEYTSNI